MQFNGSAFTELNVNIEDCEFGISAAEVYIFNAGSQVSSMQNISMKNNIFYVQSGTTMTKFKLIHSDKLTAQAINFDANTFDKTVIDTNIMRIGDVSSTIFFMRNLFVGCSSGTEIKLITLRVNANASNITGEMRNNYSYTTEAYGAYTYPEGVSQTVGAKRSGMSSTSTDKASVDYTSVDLGSI